MSWDNPSVASIPRLHLNFLFFGRSMKLRYTDTVTSGSRNKISLKFKKCAISNKSIQNGQHGRFRKTKKKQKKAQRTPHPTQMCKRQAEKSPRRRRRQRIPMLCHLNSKNAWEDSKKTYNPSMDFLENSETS